VGGKKTNVRAGDDWERSKEGEETLKKRGLLRFEGKMGVARNSGKPPPLNTRWIFVGLQRGRANQGSPKPRLKKTVQTGLFESRRKTIEETKVAEGTLRGHYRSHNKGECYEKAVTLLESTREKPLGGKVRKKEVEKLGRPGR